MKTYVNKKNIQTVLGVAALVFIILIISSGPGPIENNSQDRWIGLNGNFDGDGVGTSYNANKPTKEDIILDNGGQPIEKNGSIYFSGKLLAPAKYLRISLSSGSYYADIDPDGVWTAEIPLSKIHTDDKRVSFVANFSEESRDYNTQYVNAEIGSIPGFKPLEYEKVALNIDWSEKTPIKTDIKSNNLAIQNLVGITGFKVGEVASGDYSGYGLYVTNGFCEEMCYSTYSARFLMNEDGTKVVILSTQGLSLSSMEISLGGYGEDRFGSLNQHDDIVDNFSLFIPEIELSKSLGIKDSAYKLNEIYSLKSHVTPRFSGGESNQSKVIGYTVDGRSVLGGRDIYIERKDGTYGKYKIDMPFYGEEKIPQIKWTDGTSNESGYLTEVATGCGASSMYTIRDDINLNSNNFKIGGLTINNDLVYIHVDPNHPDLVKLHNERGWSGYGENREKVPYDEFIETIPLFFWTSPFGQIIEFKRQEYRVLAECGKPVIYLYPEEEVEAHVRVGLRGEITVSEPEHGLYGWNVVAHTNGYVTNLVDRLVYPNLFWEGYGVHYEIPDKGFVVSQDDISTWLPNTLDKIGFIEREKTEFLEFWIDEIPKTPYVFFTFIDQKYFDEYAPLEISPKPDTVSRVFMEYKGLDEYVDVEPLVLPKIIRKGFTVVEWGGALRDN
jgi:hypothetical protein